MQVGVELEANFEIELPRAQNFTTALQDTNVKTLSRLCLSKSPKRVSSNMRQNLYNGLNMS